MKVQYFGDVNDYWKYILLRRIACGLKLGICWMLTPDDERADGAKRGYLQQTAAWRSFDPDLFDFLRCVQNPPTEDCFRKLEVQCMIPGASFFAKIVPQAKDERRQFHEECRSAFKECEMVFFDPDNGLEVQSHPRGQARACKYIFYDELAAHYKDGRSVLVYQHFPRRDREAFLVDTSTCLAAGLAGAEVTIIQTAHVAFLGAVRPEHSNAFSRVQKDLHRPFMIFRPTAAEVSP